MGDTAMNVPVSLRTHEVQQLQTMVPAAARDLRETGVDTLVEDGDTLTRIADEHLIGLDGGGTVSMPVDDWQTVVGNVDRAGDDLAVWWLRAKLVKRLQEVLDNEN